MIFSLSIAARLLVLVGKKPACSNGMPHLLFARLKIKKYSGPMDVLSGSYLWREFRHLPSPSCGISEYRGDTESFVTTTFLI
jgi:hypothetical protein